MIYLFSQIAISLALAAIVGGAIGWLAHRARAGKQIRHLQQVVARQQQHVNEAQTEVSIIAGDFDDLKHRSESEINLLKQENQKIPALHQNLEKSQLLVRQLMQQHKAELDEVVAENEKLVSKSKLVDEREQAVTKLQAELESKRLSTRAGVAANSVEKNVADKPVSEKSGLAEQAEMPLTDNHITANAVPTDREPALNDSEIAKDKHVASGRSATAHAEKALDTNSTSNVEPNNAVDDQAAIKKTRLPLSGNTIELNSGLAIASAENDSMHTAVPSAAETEAELKALRDQLAEDAPAHPTPTVTLDQHNKPQTLSETEVDDAELEPLFDPVEQHDDLKQIFGIGPVTEKTLNKLGITAYSQLAELKQHDIEKIADALQIFPGRIERDNWVGSARSQLEEVLEDL